MSNKAPEKVTPRPTLPPHAPHVRLSSRNHDGRVRCETSIPVVLIGSRRDCQLPVPHPDVSRVHCAVVSTGDAVLVCDLLSRTGTFLNDQPIRTAALKRGDVLRAGPIEVRVDFPPINSPARRAASADPLALAAPLTLESVEPPAQITRQATIIGRRQGADVRIDTPDVSLAHALLFEIDGRPVICDLGSRSGTFVNDQRAELAWLANGDELNIGGQKFTVRWEPAAAMGEPAADGVGEVETSVAAAAKGAAAATREDKRVAAVGTTAPATADLADLERTIAAVQSQIGAARSQIDERRAELERREAQLNCQLLELEPRRAALAQAEAELEQRVAATLAAEEAARQLEEAARGVEAAAQARFAELEEHGQALEQKREELEQHQQAVAQQQQAAEQLRQTLEEQQRAVSGARAEVNQRQAELEQKAAQAATEAAALAQARERLAADQGALEQQVAEQAQARAALEQQAADMAQREAGLAARTEELAAREAAQREREEQEGQYSQKIAQFKSALHRASELFAAVAAPGSEGTVNAGAESGSAEKAAARAGVAATAPPRSAAPVARPPAAADGPLPAPMVDQPLFNATQATPPADWPNELRERYRVLRRVSSKSNEELLAQVWAERGRAPQPSEQPPAKKRRFRWGN